MAVLHSGVCYHVEGQSCHSLPRNPTSTQSQECFRQGSLCYDCENGNNVLDPQRTSGGCSLSHCLPCRYPVLGKGVHLDSSGELFCLPALTADWRGWGMHVLCRLWPRNNRLLFLELNINHLPPGVPYSKLRPNSSHKWFSAERP